MYIFAAKFSRRGRGSVRALRSVDRRTTKIRITGCPAARLPEILAHFSVLLFKTTT